MSKSSDQESLHSTEDEEVFAELAKALKPIPPPAKRAAPLRSRIMERIDIEKRSAMIPLLTMRAEEGWFELAPKIEKKVLNVDRETGGILSIENTAGGRGAAPQLCPHRTDDCSRR